MDWTSELGNGGDVSGQSDKPECNALPRVSAGSAWLELETDSPLRLAITLGRDLPSSIG